MPRSRRLPAVLALALAVTACGAGDPDAALPTPVVATPVPEVTPTEAEDASSDDPSPTTDATPDSSPEPEPAPASEPETASEPASASEPETASEPEADDGSGSTPEPSSPTEPEPSASDEPVAAPEPVVVASAPPDWFQTRFHPDTATGYPAPQPIPPEYVDRRLVTQDVLPPPSGSAFVSTVGAVPADVLARSTWSEACPVTPDQLAYVTVSFWGFDGEHHTGELLVADHLADDAVAMFSLLHEQRFPIERMVITSTEELDGFHNRGDDNTTAAFECRPVTGGGGWSRHAYGRAIDINPFHNPYVKDEAAGRVLLPVYAGAYLDRSRDVPGTIDEGDAVVRLFDQLGWEWGGRWNTLKDWQHVVCRVGAPCDR